jgi:putative transposase
MDSPGETGEEMKKSRFAESQIVAILKAGEAGVPVAEILRKHGISRGTYFNWRSKYAGVSVPELKKKVAPSRHLPCWAVAGVY